MSMLSPTTSRTERVGLAAPARTADPRVLIADDQADVLEALRLLLKAEGFQLETASSPAGSWRRSRHASSTSR